MSVVEQTEWFKLYPFMTDECYLAKWGIIRYFIETYCENPRILDLGCGFVTIQDFMNVPKWTGIDNNLEVIKYHQEMGRECLPCDMSSTPAEMRDREGSYDCISWIGMTKQDIPYSDVLSLYLPYLSGKGVVILEQMTPRVGDKMLEQIKGLLLTQINGCTLGLPFIRNKGRWGNLGRRTVGVFTNNGHK